jgi:fluoroquinolone resistance protein
VFLIRRANAGSIGTVFSWGTGGGDAGATCPSKCWSLRLPFPSDFGTGKHVDSENEFMSGAGILSQSHHENESFQRQDILDTDLGAHRWESCHFGNCNFSNSRLGSNSFINCTFTDCDLSNVSVASASFVRVVFIRCKMLGIKWTEAKQLLFSITLESCNISFNNFFGMKLKKIKMFDCRAEGAIFSEANMSGAQSPENKFSVCFV